MTDGENVPPAHPSEVSLIELALRVLRGELTEAQAIEIVKAHPTAKDESP
jgi:hypothetical protein